MLDNPVCSTRMIVDFINGASEFQVCTHTEKELESQG
jgi:hypothetical protein